MENKKNNTLFYHEWIPLFESLSYEIIGKLFIAIIKQDAFGTEPDRELFEGEQGNLLKGFYNLMLSAIQRNNKKYKETSQKRKIAGLIRAGKLPKDATIEDLIKYEEIQSNTKCYQMLPNGADNEREREREREREYERGRGRERESCIPTDMLIRNVFTNNQHNKYPNDMIDEMVEASKKLMASKHLSATESALEVKSHVDECRLSMNDNQVIAEIKILHL